jgi:hypothetical protein
METTDELYEIICKYPDKKLSFYQKKLLISDKEFQDTIQKMVRDNIVSRREGKLYLIDVEGVGVEW